MAERMPTDRAGRAVGETLALAVGAFVSYLALRQRALHGTDWRWLVLWADEPGTVHPNHPGYLLLARGFAWLLRPFGFVTVDALGVLSALGGAVAVAAVFQASLALRADRAFARTAALLAFASPSLFHFATVVEMHAPFAAVMAIAAGSAVRHVQTGSPGGAVRTGLLTAAAALLHATGQLLVPAIAAAAWWGSRGRGFLRASHDAALFVVTHALVWGGLYAAIRFVGTLPGALTGPGGAAVGTPDTEGPLGYFVASFGGGGLLSHLPSTLDREWLRSFLPLSLLAFVAARERPLRPWLFGFTGALVVYVGATAVLVKAATDERGGYLLPLVVPAAWLTLLALPRRAWHPTVALAIACGCLFRGEPGRLPPDREFGRAAVAMASARPTVFFVAGLPELDGLWLADPKQEPIVALREYDELRAAQAQRQPAGQPFAPKPEEVVAWLHLLRAQARQKGARLVVTDRAVAWLGEQLPAFAAAWPVFAQQTSAGRLQPQTGVAGVAID